MSKLTAVALKAKLWDTLEKVQTGKMDCAQADSVAVQGREILRTIKTQLQIVHQSKRDVPTEVIDFAESK